MPPDMHRDSSDPPETWLTVPQVAEKLKVGDRTVKRYIRDGRLLAIKHANRRWVTPSALADYCARLESDAAKDAGTRTKARRANGGRRNRS